MKGKDQINAWTENNPGWMLVLTWLAASLLVFIIVSGLTYVFTLVYSTGIGVPLIAIIASPTLLFIWRTRKSPQMKAWLWMVLAIALAVVLFILFYGIAWIGFFIMGTPIGAFIASLVGGGIIVGALYLNQRKKK